MSVQASFFHIHTVTSPGTLWAPTTQDYHLFPTLDDELSRNGIINLFPINSSFINRRGEVKTANAVKTQSRTDNYDVLGNF